MWSLSMSTHLSHPLRSGRSTFRSWLKFTVFALLPAVALVSGLELILRLTEATRPTKSSIPLPEELAGMLRPDATLMWSLVPSQRYDYANQSAGYRTNSLGLRNREVSLDKRADEYRILSLGESTTYGYGVGNDDTYSARLEAMLNSEAGTKQQFQVINAGVPAWSSFQSLMFLKERGIKLKPDMVLFYHEFNDYLPTSYRSSGSTQKLGLSKSDREIYESLSGKLSRGLLAYSAIFRFIQYQIETQRMADVAASQGQDDRAIDPTLRSQLDQIGISPRLVGTQEGKPDEIDESQLPRRVSSAERRQILHEMADFCEEHGIQLVIIHPSYRFTQPHKCLLTEFCESRGIPLFDAHPSLHQPSLSLEEQFMDTMHPTAMAHAKIASDLYAFLWLHSALLGLSGPQ